MTVLWTNDTAAEATGGKAQGQWQAARVEIDSRRIRKDDLFVAIQGENFDGHSFVKDALAKGAVAAVTSVPMDGPSLLVPDTLKALEDLGKYARARSRAKIVGVTGSVGKTSAKEMLRLALSTHGEAYATTGNFNNHIGTPLNLANLAPEIPYAVFEMGMNHAGEISHLTNMVRPHVAAITSVEAAHMEFFASIEAIAEAKAEIFEGVEPGGTAVLNVDNPMFGLLAEKASARGIAHVTTFGAKQGSDCQLLEYKATAAGCDVTASIFGRRMRYTLSAVGRHWALTSLLVLACTHALGLDPEKTARALADFHELEGRGSVTTIHVRAQEVVLIDDSYNASPAAMRAAFAKTAEVWEAHGRKGRKVAALGDMRELGPEAVAMHAGLAEGLREHGFDAVFTAGELMQQLYEVLPQGLRAGHVAQASQLLPLLQGGLGENDVLLVKGSHGSKMYEVAAALHKAHEEKKHAV